MTINKKLDDWKEITKKINFVRNTYSYECDERQEYVREIEALIGKYVTSYHSLYDPVNPPISDQGIEE